MEPVVLEILGAFMHSRYTSIEKPSIIVKSLSVKAKNNKFIRYVKLTSIMNSCPLNLTDPQHAILQERMLSYKDLQQKMWILMRLSRREKQVLWLPYFLLPLFLKVLVVVVVVGP